MGETTSDCRTDIGVTIGLIDSIIFIARVLRTRQVMDVPDVREALIDLQSDEDVNWLINSGAYLPPK